MADGFIDPATKSGAYTSGNLKPVKWQIIINEKGTYKIIKAGSEIPSGHDKVGGTFKTKKSANNKIKNLKVTQPGAIAQPKFKSPGKGRLGTQTFGDKAWKAAKLGGKAALGVARAIPGTAAAMALETALGPGQGLTDKQKATAREAGIPVSKLGGTSQRSFTEMEGTINRAKQRQADRDAAKAKRSDRRERAGQAELEANMPRPAPKRNVVEDIPGMDTGRKPMSKKKILDTVSPTKQQTMTAQKRAGKAQRFRPMPKPAPKRNVVEDIPGMDPGKLREISKKKILNTISPRKAPLAMEDPREGGVSGDEKPANRALSWQERLKSENVRKRRKDESPRPAPKSRSPRTPAFKGVGGVPAYGPAPLNKASATTEADPLPKDTTKRPVPQKVAGSTSGKKEAFMKRKTASDKPHRYSPEEYTSSGRRNVPDTKEFVGLKEANRNRVIKDAVADLKKKKYTEEFTGEKEWRDPDKITTKAQRIDPSLKQKRRGQYSANKRDEDEWERMREENQGARKGGKITKKKATRKQAAPKKSSTSHRSRPKNPTLQKTSYNY